MHRGRGRESVSTGNRTYPGDCRPGDHSKRPGVHAWPFAYATLAAMGMRQAEQPSEDLEGPQNAQRGSSPQHVPMMDLAGAYGALA